MATDWQLGPLMPGLLDAIVLARVAGVTETSFALNAAYAYNTGGAGVALYTFFAPETADLTDFYVLVKSYAGTWGATDGNIDWAIHEGLAATNRPGSVVASGTLTLDGTTGWKKKSGLTVGLTAGRFYTLVVSDADGGGTNFVTLTCRYGDAVGLGIGRSQTIITTTNGFSSAGSSVNGCPSCAVKIGGRWYGGSYHDTVSAVTTGTYRRGVRFRPVQDMVVAGVIVNTDTTALSGGHTFELIADSQPPSGSKIRTWAPPSTSTGGGTNPHPSSIIFPSADWQIVEKDTWYRFVILLASSLTVPRKATSAASPPTELIEACQPFNGCCHWTNDSSGSWVDEPASMCLMGPLLVPRSASGGGGVIIG